MTQKILSMMAAVAVAGAFATPTAQAISAKAYKDALADKIGNKTGTSAYKAAAKVLGGATQLEPKKVKNFAALTAAALKKIATATSSNTTFLLKQMTAGIFKTINYTVGNKKLNSAVKFLVKKIIKADKKNETKIDKLFKTFTSLNNKFNGTTADLQAWADLVYRAAGLTPPIIS
jgi:hypothetical protein